MASNSSISIIIISSSYDRSITCDKRTNSTCKKSGSIPMYSTTTTTPLNSSDDMSSSAFNK